MLALLVRVWFLAGGLKFDEVNWRFITTTVNWVVHERPDHHPIRRAAPADVGQLANQRAARFALGDEVVLDLSFGGAGHIKTP